MNNVRSVTAAVLGALALPVLTASPSHAAPAAPDDVSVEVATVNGSGCPAGTSAVTLSDHNTAFTVTFSDFLAYAGGDADPTAMRKNCQIVLRVNAPRDYTYAVRGTDQTGFAGIEAGATGVVRTNYYFQGHSQNRSDTHVINGRTVGEWRFTDRIADDQLAYKPCGEDRNLNINTELRVNAGNSDKSKISFLSMDSLHGSARYDFAWKRCSS